MSSEVEKIKQEIMNESKDLVTNPELQWGFQLFGARIGVCRAPR